MFKFKWSFWVFISPFSVAFKGVTSLLLIEWCTLSMNSDVCSLILLFSVRTQSLKKKKTNWKQLIFLWMWAGTIPPLLPCCDCPGLVCFTGTPKVTTITKRTGTTKRTLHGYIQTEKRIWWTHISNFDIFHLKTHLLRNTCICKMFVFFPSLFVHLRLIYTQRRKFNNI